MNPNQVLLLRVELQKIKLLLNVLIHNHVAKRRRSCSVRKLLKERPMKGYYASLIPRMRVSDVETFKNFHRMDPQGFDQLLGLLGANLRKKPIRYREEITPSERLAITLRYVASGDSMKSVGFYGFRIGATTTSNIIRETCQLIWNKLQFVFPTPSEAMWQDIAKDFYECWGFPNCLGAIDGKHVVVQAFAKHNSLTFNYKHTHSLVLMAIADAKYKFIMVDIGALGHNSDGGVFKTSTFGNNILNYPENLHIPSDRKLPLSDVVAPFVFVGDEAFPLRKNLMRPYPGRNTTTLPVDESKFNTQLSRARRVVENAFGILANRFRIYRKPIIASKETVKNIVKATVCLHNWLRDKSPDVFNAERSNEIADQNLVQIRTPRHNHAGAEASNVRKMYTKFFIDIENNINGI